MVKQLKEVSLEKTTNDMVLIKSCILCKDGDKELNVKCAKCLSSHLSLFTEVGPTVLNKRLKLLEHNSKIEVT